MASPSVTHTFVNGTTADASQVNTNFNDIINGITDGTKDLSISALTCAGTATFNGNMTIGNAATDTLTITSDVISDITIDKSSGDPAINFQIGGTNKFTFGVDDTDSDNFKISTNEDLSFEIIEIESAGTVRIGTVDINGGAVDGTTVGAASASTGAFTTLSATGNVSFDGGTFVFNESAADKDFRIETTSEVDAFWTDAGNNQVNVGSSGNRMSTGQPFQVWADVDGYAIYATNANGDSHCMRMEATATDANDATVIMLLMEMSTGSTNGNYYQQFVDGGGEIGSIRGNGTGVDFNTTSDERLKTDIKNYEVGLSDVNRLRPVRFKRKATGAPNIGFIAQEVLDVVPEATKGDPNGDPEKNPMSLSAINLIPAMVKAIQELSDKVAKLEAR